MSILTDIIIKYWPVFPAVFVAGIVDAIAGGGGCGVRWFSGVILAVGAGACCLVGFDPGCLG